METREQAIEGDGKDPSLGQPVLSSDDRGVQADLVTSTHLGVGSTDDEHVVVERTAIDEPDEITDAVRRYGMGTCGDSLRSTRSPRFVPLSLPASSLQNPFACSLQSVEWVLPTSAFQLVFAFPRPERGLESPEKRGDRLGLPDVRDAETPDGAGNDPSDEPHMLNRSDQETQADPTESKHRAGSSTEAQRLDVELAALSDEGDASTRANDAQRQGVESAVGDAAAPAVTRQACARTFGSRMRLSLLPLFVMRASFLLYLSCSWMFLVLD